MIGSLHPSVLGVSFQPNDLIPKNHGQRRKKLFARTLYRANICRTISMEIAFPEKFFPVPRLLARAAPPNL